MSVVNLTRQPASRKATKGEDWRSRTWWGVAFSWLAARLLHGSPSVMPASKTVAIGVRRSDHVTVQRVNRMGRPLPRTKGRLPVGPTVARDTARRPRDAAHAPWDVTRGLRHPMHGPLVATRAGRRKTSVGLRVARAGKWKTSVGFRGVCAGSRNTTTGLRRTRAGSRNTTTGLRRTRVGSRNTTTGFRGACAGSRNTTTGLRRTRAGRRKTSVGFPGACARRRKTTAGFRGHHMYSYESGLPFDGRDYAVSASGTD